MTSGCYVYAELHETVTKSRRSYCYFLLQGHSFGACLEVIQNGKADVYGVEEITQAEGEAMVAWRLFVVVKAEPAEEGIYLVRIPGRLNATGKPSCQCFGYNSHQHCKHIDCLTDLCKRGQI